MHNSITTNKKVWSLIISLTMVFIFGCGVLTSTNPIWGYSGVDSACFIVMGRGILEGRVPYRDLVDNKGLVLYLINALGQSAFLNTKFVLLGIWLIELLSLFISLRILVRISKMLGMKREILVQVAYLLIILPLIESGNLGEEYSNLITLICFYLCVDFFVCRNKKLWEYGFVFGISFTLNFFIRPNNALPIAGIVFIIVVVFIVSKKWKALCISAISFVIGAILVMSPIWIYLISTNAALDCLMQTFGANLQYKGDSGSTFLGLLNTTYGYMACFYLFIALIGIYLQWEKNDKNENSLGLCLCVLASALLSFLSAFISGHTYNHYLLISTVPFIMGLIFIWNSVEDGKSTLKKGQSFFSWDCHHVMY